MTSWMNLRPPLQDWRLIILPRRPEVLHVGPGQQGLREAVGRRVVVSTGLHAHMYIVCTIKYPWLMVTTSIGIAIHWQWNGDSTRRQILLPRNEDMKILNVDKIPPPRYLLALFVVHQCPTEHSLNLISVLCWPSLASLFTLPSVSTLDSVSTITFNVYH